MIKSCENCKHLNMIKDTKVYDFDCVNCKRGFYHSLEDENCIDYWEESKQIDVCMASPKGKAK